MATDPRTDARFTARHLSPTALNRFLGCEHRTFLDILEGRGELDAERKPPKMELLFERGARHEDDVVAGMQAQGREVVSLDDPDATPAERAHRTLEAMQVGHEILHQACFVNGGWIGYPDFLVRTDTPSKLGSWSYEAHDAKLGSHPRPDHVFQLLFYTDELARLQGVRPARMHLMLGDDTHPSFDPDDFTAYAARVRAQFERRAAELAAPGAEAAYPYPVGACEFCHWWHVCDARRREDDHLSLVAGLRRDQGLKLEQHGIATLPALAAHDLATPVPRLTLAMLTTLQAQADIQLRSRGQDPPLYELLEPGPDRGLARLPAPSPGDVHFDFEGDPYWGDDGLEYLFGTLYQDDAGAWVYEPRWATSRAQEKAAFESWVDWLVARLERYPDLHVFHYNSYETAALKRLMVRHATREAEIDQLLRRKVFVDLYGITRQAIRAGTEGYGLKPLEPVFGFERDAELRGAIGSLHRWQAFQQDGDHAHLDGIAGYNEDDCHSTRVLYDWLQARRPEAEAQYGVSIAALAAETGVEPSESALRFQARLEDMRGPLLGGLPDDESLDTLEQRAYRTTFGLLGYHRREANPVWWALFHRRDHMSLDQLRDEDAEAIAGLEVVSCEDLGRSWQWTMEFPEQEYKLGPGGVDEPLAERSATIVSLDEANRTLVVKRGKASGDDPPVALAPAGPLQTTPQVNALFRFAQRLVDGGLDQPLAGIDLLRAAPPRFVDGTPPLQGRDIDLDRLKEQVLGLDRSALVIQGPPGTGKTYTGARLALDLVGRGKRIGVCATSHKAIDNFLRALEEAADEAGTTFRGWRKKPGEGEGHSSERIVCTPKPPSPENGPVQVIAGTAWLWASEAQQADPVDVLFVDEAGQVALADAIAISGGAHSVVLLGDPQQLAHVSQGSHPLHCGVSVLEHLLQGEDVVPDDRGVLLNRTWRMHPAVTGFVSRTMYAGLLEAVDGCQQRRIDSPGLSGSGLRLITVDHLDNRGRSAEEAEVVAALVDELLAGGTYACEDEDPRPLTIDDVLVVAPYNAQVRCLRAALAHHEGARVGTVDKFQGQEAPVVLFSMASSTSEDVSRGMSFLFSRNRLNVAVSRAQAMAVVVCSPRLFEARCSTVDDMRLVNMLCRFADEAEVVARLRGEARVG